MTITQTPPSAVEHAPVSPPRTAGSPPAGTASPPAGSASPTTKRKTITPGRDTLLTVLSLVAAVGGTAVGVIGFAMSYTTLAQVALSWGFSPQLAPWFPVGVDASIVAFLALDLYLIRKAIPWPVLRMAAHGMTGATIWFNASSQGDIVADPVQAASHGVMPVMFVIGVEAARRLFIKKTQLEAGTAADRIPLHRWILSPLDTPKFYRRMRLHGITSYPEMIRREQDLTGYEQWLTRKYRGKVDQASEDERLPMKMARYGYTVAQALELPEKQERDADQRKADAERRRLEAATQREIDRKRAEAEQIKAQGELDAVRARVDSETAQARAHAQAQVSAAERAAELEEAAEQNALVAEAKARAAAAERQEADERRAQAAADAEAAELERQAARKRKEAAEADRAAAAEAAAFETQAAAEARKAAAEANRAADEAEQAAAEARRDAAEADAQQAAERARQAQAEAEAEESRRAALEARERAAEIEYRAVEIEDAARMSPRQRAVRKVARMIQFRAGGDPGQLQLADIQAELGVSSSATASEYRKEAAELLAAGTDPAAQ